MENVLCGVKVSVVNSPAGRTSPLSDGKIFYACVLVSANAAKLTGRIKLIDFDESASAICQLVGEHLCEHSPAVIKRCLPVAKTFVCDSLHVKIFDAYSCVLIGYLSRSLMQEVFSLVCDMLCGFANARHRIFIGF